MLSVDLWLWSLEEADEHLDHFVKDLSVDELRRADRFVKSSDRSMYIVGRAGLRRILADYIGLAAKAVKFEYGPHGKPFLQNGPGFNLSHSGGRAALAVCSHAHPGLDIELVRPIEDAVARHHFSPVEYAELSCLQPSDWLQGFFRCWTRKEAVLKSLGHGLYMPLDSFDVTLSPDVLPRLTRIENDDPLRWTLTHFEPAPGWIGALALRDTGGPVELRWRSGDPIVRAYSRRSRK